MMTTVDTSAIETARQLAACTDTDDLIKFYAGRGTPASAEDAYPRAFGRAAGLLRDLLYIIDHVHSAELAEARAAGYGQGHSEGIREATDGG
jgi:hypothetical protein